jgi:Glycosyl transferases group 1
LKIVLIGQSHWARDVAAGVNEFTDAQVTVVPMDTARDVPGLLRLRDLRGADVLVRVGFRPGADTPRGRTFDAALSAVRVGARGRAAYFWIGTDVANALSQAARGDDMRRFRRLTADATHVADSYQLRDELRGLGIDAAVAWMPPRHVNRGPALPAFPDRFTVLSYVPDLRHDFYGGPVLLEVARRLPDVRFRITSGEGGWASSDAPENVTFLGRVPDVAPLFAESSCLVRTVEHDGLSGMVLEALSYGRQVVYSARLPHTVYARFGDADALETALRGLVARSASVPSEDDAAAAAWVRSISDKRECWATLLSALTGGPGRPEETVAGAL